MTKDLPNHYQNVMPYLILKEAGKFVQFMQNVFNAVETMRIMRDPDTIMHGEVMVGTSTIMFAECTDAFSPCTAGMFIYVDNADERYRKALAEGAVSLTEVSDQSYGRSGGVRDPFGNSWWITSI